MPAPLSARARLRRAGATGLTLLAALSVWVVLALPDELALISPSAFLRVPVELVLVVLVAAVLPGRWRRVGAVLLGLALAVVLVAKALDIGFTVVLDRDFDPVIDWSNLGRAVVVLRETNGTGAAVGACVGAGLATLAALVVLPLAVLRVTRPLAAHRRPSLVGGAVLGLAWVLAATTGLRVSPAGPVASASTTALVTDDVRAVRAGLRDRETFAEAIGRDRFAQAPAEGLLAGLAGKDVLLVFVESYGRVAVQDSSFAPEVARVLDDGTARLGELGFSARSGFLTSPTFGAGSWLAHATLQTGLWVDTQQRYDQLFARQRLTLSALFERAGWRSVFTLPAVRNAWPEGAAFYGYDQLYDADNVGYRGPRFGWSRMPDQYVLDGLQRLELAEADRQPVMAEVDLSSSHHPWTPLPSMVPWDELGDGTVFDHVPGASPSEEQVFADPDLVREMYGRSVVYSWEALISFVEQHPDPDRVFVVLGDHQPHSYVSGTDADHDVPVTVLAHDPAVLDRIADWGWDDGLRPAPDAPVWPMDDFRDRFLDAFGSP